MRPITLLVIALAAAGCDSKCPPDARCSPVSLADAQDDVAGCSRARTSVCNPLTQSGCPNGEKCTWLLNALEPMYIGYVGCAPVGGAGVGEPCTYGPPGCDGYDNCARGLVCSDSRGGVGTCQQICDPQGGLPACDAQQFCALHPDLFRYDDAWPAVAGVCDPLL